MRWEGRSPRPCRSNGGRREEGGGANWWGLANQVACGAIYPPNWGQPVGGGGRGWETTCGVGCAGDCKWKCSGLVCGPERQGGESGIIHTRSADKDKSPPQAGRQHEEGWARTLNCLLVRAARHTLPFSAISLSRKVRCWSGKGQLIPGRRAQWRARGQVRCHNRSPGWSGAGTRRTLPCHRTRVAGRPWEEMAGSQWGPFRARTAQGSRLQQQGGGEPWEAGRWNHNKHKSPAASAGALQRTRLSFARAGHCRQLRRVPLSSQHLLQLLTPAEADEHSPRSEHVPRTNAISRRPCEAGAIRRRGSTGKLDLKGIFKPKNKRMDLPDH